MITTSRLLIKVAVCIAVLAVSQEELVRAGEFEDVEIAISKNSTTMEIKDHINSFIHDSRNKLYLAFYNLSSYLPLSIEYAETVGRDCNIVDHNGDFYSIVGIALSGCFAVLGILFAFFGYRLIKIVLFLIGFVTGGSLTYFIILAFASDSMHEEWVPYTAAGVSIVVGILCGVLTICIYYIGIFLSGASVGFLGTWFILSVIDIAFFREHIYVPIIGAVAGAILIGLMSLWIQKWFFMLGTSLLGTFMLSWGVDYFLELGLMVYYLFLFAEHRSGLEPCWYSWILIPFFIVCAVSAFIVQAALTGKKYNHSKELKGICCGLCKKKRKVLDGKYMELASKEE